MQTILSIDVAADPACALVLGIEGKGVKILAKHYASLGGLFSRDNMLGPTLLPAPDGQAPSTPAPDSFPSSSPEENSLEQQRNSARSLRPLLDQIQAQWHAALLLIPPYDYLSMNLTLPFGDARSLNKVIDLEVQDLVPFDVPEFLVQYHLLKTLPGNLHDIHVSLLPKTYLQAVLRICRQSQFDPMIISTAAGALGGAYQLAPEFFDPDSAILFAQRQFCYVCIAHEGMISTDRIVSFPAAAGLRARQALITEVKLTLRAHEETYQKTLQRVYYLGNHLPLEELQRSLGRNIEPIKAEQFVRGADDNSGPAVLAGIFLRDVEPPPLLTNFRAREFAYSPQLRELFHGLKMLAPYLAALLVIGLISLGAAYLAREYRFRRVERAIAAEIVRQLPDLQRGEASLAAVNEKIKRLEDELKDLGSPSQFTPLDAFANISEDLSRASKEIPDLSLTSLNITPNWITAELDAPDYKDGERIEKSLKNKRQKNIYCKVQREDLGRSGLTNKRFRFKIRICEQ